MSINKPKISVLMSVYNGSPYLANSIESILLQTYNDFEFIIIDDGSNDGSSDLIKQYQKQDNRIIFIQNTERLGLGANLRNAVNIAQGQLIARMDADDIAVKNRFEKQVQFLNENQEIDILGSYAEDIDAGGKIIGLRRCPTQHLDIVKYIWTCPLIHPTIMMRRDSLIKIGSYGTEKRRQDYALWFRATAAGLKFANLPEPLLQYRFTEDYFRKNSIKPLLYQAKIGLCGAYMVKASPVAYIGVLVPVIKGLLPPKLAKILAGILKKFDPRNRIENS